MYVSCISLVYLRRWKTWNVVWFQAGPLDALISWPLARSLTHTALNVSSEKGPFSEQEGGRKLKFNSGEKSAPTTARYVSSWKFHGKFLLFINSGRTYFRHSWNLPHCISFVLEFGYRSSFVFEFLTTHRFLLDFSCGKFLFVLIEMARSLLLIVRKSSYDTFLIC
jgi:hypothetical protein